MSGTASVPNTFASQSGNIPLQQLDTNFVSIIGYLNDPTNRNNYAADTGSANTYAVALSPAALGYTAGLELALKATTANTGASTLNANGLGAQNWINPDGTNLAAGQVAAGGVYKAVHNGSAFVFIGSPNSPASQAQMTTATASSVFVSPGTQRYHPGMPKAVAMWNGTSTGTITADYSYNITSIVRNSAGDYSLNLTSPMADTKCAVIGMPSGAHASNFLLQLKASALPTTAVVTVQAVLTGTGPSDPAFVSVAIYGTLP